MIFCSRKVRKERMPSPQRPISLSFSLRSLRIALRALRETGYQKSSIP